MSTNQTISKKTTRASSSNAKSSGNPPVFTIGGVRINKLKNFTGGLDGYLAVDNEVLGTGRMTIPELAELVAGDRTRECTAQEMDQWIDEVENEAANG